MAYAIDALAHGWLVALLGRVLSFGKIHSKTMHEILAALEQETARRAGRG